MIAGVLLSATKQASQSAHPVWHYLIIPAIGAVLFACIGVPDLIRAHSRRRQKSPDGG